MMKRKYTWKCPIKGVSQDCGYCLQDGWHHCVYVKVWKERQKGKSSKSSPYVPFVVQKHSEETK